MKFKYKTYNHANTSIRYHIIFSTKYRRKCLSPIKEDVIASFRYAESKSHFKILNMSIENDHVHFLITFPPKYSIVQTVRRLKQVSTNYLYNKHYDYLKKFYRKSKNIIWTGGYFISTIGEVSEEKLNYYINNQG